MNRRGFFRNLAYLCAAVPAVALFNETKAFAKAVVHKKAKLATTTGNATAKAMKYVKDAKKAKRAVKMGVAGDKQTCLSCSFYKEPGTLEGTKEKVGTCMLFQNDVVHEAGWCSGWAPKPK